MEYAFSNQQMPSALAASPILPSYLMVKVTFHEDTKISQEWTFVTNNGKYRLAHTIPAGDYFVVVGSRRMFNTYSVGSEQNWHFDRVADYSELLSVHGAELVIQQTYATQPTYQARYGGNAPNLWLTMLMLKWVQWQMVCNINGKVGTFSARPYSAPNSLTPQVYNYEDFVEVNVEVPEYTAFRDPETTFDFYLQPREKQSRLVGGATWYDNVIVITAGYSVLRSAQYTQQAVVGSYGCPTEDRGQAVTTTRNIVLAYNTTLPYTISANSIELTTDANQPVAWVKTAMGWSHSGNWFIGYYGWGAVEGGIRYASTTVCYDVGNPSLNVYFTGRYDGWLSGFPRPFNGKYVTQDSNGFPALGTYTATREATQAEPATTATATIAGYHTGFGNGESYVACTYPSATYSEWMKPVTFSIANRSIYVYPHITPGVSSFKATTTFTRSPDDTPLYTTDRNIVSALFCRAVIAYPATSGNMRVEPTTFFDEELDQYILEYDIPEETQEDIDNIGGTIEEASKYRLPFAGVMQVRAKQYDDDTLLRTSARERINVAYEGGMTGYHLDLEGGVPVSITLNPVVESTFNASIPLTLQVVDCLY